MCYNIGVLIIYKEGVNVAKKKTKREKKKGFAYSSELYGVIFLLAGIIGIGKYGPVGNLISSSLLKGLTKYCTFFTSEYFKWVISIVGFLVFA